MTFLDPLRFISEQRHLTGLVVVLGAGAGDRLVAQGEVLHQHGHAGFLEAEKRGVGLGLLFVHELIMPKQV